MKRIKQGPRLGPFQVREWVEKVRDGSVTLDEAAEAIKRSTRAVELWCREGNFAHLEATYVQDARGQR